MRVEPIERRSGGPFLEQRSPAEVVCDEMQLPVEFGDAPGRSSGGGPICVIRKPPCGSGIKVVGDAGIDGFRGKQESGMTLAGNIEKEDAVLTPEDAQQSPAAQCLSCRPKDGSDGARCR